MSIRPPAVAEHAFATHDPGHPLTFDVAFRALRTAAKVKRTSWGDDTYVVLQKGYPDGIKINKNTAEATGVPEGTVCKFSPYLMRKAPDDSFAPWLPSQLDLFAQDWIIVT